MRTLQCWTRLGTFLNSVRGVVSLLAGLRLCLGLVHRTRKEIHDTLKYLYTINQQRARLPDDINMQCLRLGLELINVPVQKSAEDDATLLLDTVMSLQPDQIRIPRQCWEMAGRTQRIYTSNTQLPLTQQLEELGASVWRMTACYKEGSSLMGNLHVAFIASALVTVPCPLLKELLWVDYVGYIPGDQTCQEAHSRVRVFAVCC